MASCRQTALMFTKTIPQRPTSTNDEFNLMNSSKPVGGDARSRRGAWIGGILAVVVVVVGGVWLARKPIAEGVGRSFCSGEGLDCELHFSRLDFGGVALRDLDVRAAGAERAAVRAGALAVDLAWNFPLTFRTRSIDADDVELRVNLSGEGGVLGDLDEVVRRQMNGAQPSAGPAPAMAFRNVRIIGETEWGEVEAVGRFVRSVAGDADIEFLAAPVRLAHSWGELDFGGAKLVANSEGQNLFGTLTFDLASMTSGERQMAGARLQMDFAQSGGSLTARADGQVETADLPEGRLRGARVHGDLLADAIDVSALTMAGVASRVRQLTIEGGADAGGVQDAELSDFTLAIDIDPSVEGGAAGDVRIAARALTHEMGRAERLEIEGRVDVPGGDPGALGRTVRASGVARLRDATLDRAASDELATSLGGLIGGALPTFGAATERAVRAAGEKFDMVLPWSFDLQDGETDLSALSGSEVAAASGFAMRLEGENGAPAVSWVAGDNAAWRAQGVMTASGGGGPPVRVELADARGGADGVSVRASGSLSGWAAGNETLSAEVRDAVYASDGETGKFSGGVTASISGVLGGVRWTRLRTRAELESEWSAQASSTSSAQNLRLDWDAAQIGGTRIGAGALTYVPDDVLAVGDADAIRGAGRLSGFESELRGSNFTGQIRLGGARVVWTRGADMRARFELEPTQVLFLTGDGGVPVDIGSVVGEARLGNGWRVNGDVERGGAVAQTAAVKDVSAGFDLSGGGARKISGALRDVAFVITDPDEDGSHLFEDMKFEGMGDLAAGAATFSGRVVMVESGVQVGDVTGRHSMDEGRGEAAFAETPLIFRPRGFQPKDLSPVLRGAANVDGRVDVSGAATWSGEGLDASARLNLRGLGFAVASAGVFEGVSGVVEVSDALRMHSEPGQTLVIEKVTLGLPIEDGVLRFQMDGFDKVRLEDARWPFVGGMIRLEPAVFNFGPEENLVIANAVNWDLAEIVELFKVPDTRIQGIVNGSFPVVFSTGSARIEDAVLEASDDGGVIQYEAETTDAASQSNENAKLLFDALKDFRYRVLKIGLDGDVAGTMLLTLNVEGMNPEVLAGAPFKLNIGIESELAELLNTLNRPRAEIDAVVRGGQQESN